MKFSVFIAASLDGYIAREDGSIDWLTSIPNPDNDDYGFGVYMNSIDAMLMGRKTFETVQSFDQWPYKVPVFVWSQSLESLPAAYNGKASIITGKVEEVVRKLKESGKHSVYVDGGRTIRAFLEADLIDEMTLTLVPVLLGKGIPLFGKLERDRHFRTIRTKLYDNSLTQIVFCRKD